MKVIDLIPCQSIDEIEFLVKNIKLDSSTFWIPLNLETYLFLKKKNFNSIDVSKYFLKNDHKNGLLESQKFLNTLKLSNNTIDLRTKGILRKFFNSIFFLITIISKIERSFKINRFILSGWSDYNNLKKNNNYFNSKIIFELYKKKYNLKIIKNLQINYKHDIFEYSLDQEVKDDKNIFFISNINYNFIRIVKNLILRKINVVILNFSKISFLKKILLNFSGVKILNIKQKFISKKKMKKSLKVFYNYKKFKFGELINHRYQQIQGELFDLRQKKILINNIFKKIKPTLVIANNARGVEGLTCECANKYKIKTAIISHGTIAKGFNNYEKIYHRNISEELVSKFHKFFCSQTKISQDSLKTIKYKNKNLNTGNLIFSETKNKVEKKYVLYAVTARDFVNMHFFGIETFYEIFEDLKVLNEISRKKKIKILVKLHPNILHLKKELIYEFPNLNFTIKKIDKALELSFATISFSSTVIEDSLCSRIPVILFDQWNRFKHCKAEKRAHVKDKAVYYINKPKELPKAINSIRNSKNINYKQYIFKNNLKLNINNFINNFI